MKNNTPRYVLIDYSQLSKIEAASDEEFSELARKTLTRHMEAFEELAQ